MASAISLEADGTTYHLIAGPRSPSEIRPNDTSADNFSSSTARLPSPNTPGVWQTPAQADVIVGWRAKHEIQERDVPIECFREMIPAALKCGDDVECCARVLESAFQDVRTRRLKEP